ncbi:DUF924 family protein [Pseudomonas sp. LS-2]|jgi:uncharacterized protein (DUF924 family)|uniref:DUF924 family protein n=1 Tax=Pseudomonas sp. LS-2 TaxID=2315859 RepID=UPI000E756155|nr:DUF924 family protein [Pseudomonas sp. LS-2]RJX76209.1 DUF924 domain-containing protein [Pseudomonas sp. LS-2]
MSAPWRPLLDWWFGSAESPTEVAKAKNKLWFGKKKSQDTDALHRFGGLVELALKGGLSEWAETPQGWLALVLLLDQLPRMIFRDTPKSFSGDKRAQELVHHGLKLERDLALSPLQRTFIYLVLEHAENLAAQDEAVRRFANLLPLLPATDREYFTRTLDYAKKHRVVIERFGRYPHRNALLGRESTVEEVEFLKERGSRF